MGRDDINNYYGPRNNNQQFINNSTVINNTYVDNSTNTTYVYGPRKDDVQNATGEKVRLIEIKENVKPGQSLENDQLRIYRPEILKSTNSTSRPQNIAEKKDVSPISERKNSDQKNNEVGPGEPAFKESIQKKPIEPKPLKKIETQKQNDPNNVDREGPIQPKKDLNVKTPQKVSEQKLDQRELQKHKNAPIKNSEKQPENQSQQLGNEASRPVPIQKNIHEKKEPIMPLQVQPIEPKPPPSVNPINPRVIEPRTNVNPALRDLPKNEQRKATKTPR
jgi:hypothetical protein